MEAGNEDVEEEDMLPHMAIVLHVSRGNVRIRATSPAQAAHVMSWRRFDEGETVEEGLEVDDDEEEEENELVVSVVEAEERRVEGDEEEERENEGFCNGDDDDETGKAGSTCAILVSSSPSSFIPSFC